MKNEVRPAFTVRELWDLLYVSSVSDYTAASERRVGLNHEAAGAVVNKSSKGGRDEICTYDSRTSGNGGS